MAPIPINSAHLLIPVLPCSYLLPTKPGEKRQNNWTSVSRDTSASRFPNPLDERIDQDQSTGSTLQPGRPQENIRSYLNPHPIRAER
jgi:hypothetical protein